MVTRGGLLPESSFHMSKCQLKVIKMSLINVFIHLNHFKLILEFLFHTGRVFPGKVEIAPKLVLKLGSLSC